MVVALAVWLCGCVAVAVAVWLWLCGCDCVALGNNLFKKGEKANQIGGLERDYGNMDGRVEGWNGCRERTGELTKFL